MLLALKKEYFIFCLLILLFTFLFEVCFSVLFNFMEFQVECLIIALISQYLPDLFRFITHLFYIDNNPNYAHLLLVVVFKLNEFVSKVGFAFASRYLLLILLS